MNSQVTVALAIYRPNLKWLEELLTSLNEQDYDNLDLLVWNDCPDDCFDYGSLFKEHISKFEYRIEQGKQNLRTGAAFSWLTQHARGEYVAILQQNVEQMLARCWGKQEIAAKAQALYSSDRMCREYIEVYTKDLFGRD